MSDFEELVDALIEKAHQRQYHAFTGGRFIDNYIAAEQSARAALLDAVRMRPASEPPDNGRWVLVQHRELWGEVVFDRGFFDKDVIKFYIREGDNCDAIAWCELPEAKGDDD
jgi:hypothetical protein